MNQIIGKPVDRVDGHLKVTGGARYATEFQLPNTVHGLCAGSTITKGRMVEIDAAEVEAAPGVLAVLTHKNAPRLHKGGPGPSPNSMLGERDLLPLQSDIIYYDGQHIAVVVAETFEQAQYAATMIKVNYETQKPVIEIEPDSPAAQPKLYQAREIQAGRGDPESALSSAEVKYAQIHTTPVLNHNPMEPSATTAVWNGDELTIYDATQWVIGTRNGVADMLGISHEKVRVISPFVGGGFGCKGSLWGHTVLAAMAARKVGRPVRLVLTRQQMFTCIGHRGRTIQQLGFGASREGKLAGIRHVTTTETSMVGEFIELAGLQSRILYTAPNVEMKHNVVRLNVGTPTQMRAPGHATGSFALESALDELAYELKLDPVELRLVNYAQDDPQENKPWSSKHLRECYQRGAEAIGWSKRRPEPRSMREGAYLVGYGMATAMYPANRMPASAKVQIFQDGHAVAASSTQDIGTGTYTIMTQIAAEALGLALERVEFKLGDSLLPEAPVSGGSQTAASVGPPVRGAALAVKNKVVALAIADGASPLHGQNAEGIEVENGRLFLRSDTSKGETYAEVLKRQRLPMVEAEATTNFSTRPHQTEEGNPTVLSPTGRNAGGRTGESAGAASSEKKPEYDERFAFHSFGAHFVKVRVDPLLCTVRVAHGVAVMDIGRVLNLKTARSQIMGGMVYGMGMALLEQTVFDPNRGRIVTRDLANYPVPVNADVPDFDVHFIGEPDPHISPMGARGIGEIGITGVVAAIANGVYHATGKRVRDLPITLDKLI
jgi:xanthine dehydrogenase YagR molybdenum-binding subunit